MKRFLNVRIWVAWFVTFIPATSSVVLAQQNNTLFFMHSLPEANYINPAVQIDCGFFIGLPVISSFHANIANSGFTGGKFVTFYTDGTVRRNENMEMNGIQGRYYFLTEFHSVLLAAGWKRNNLYYSFTITEKDNAAVIYTPDLVTFSLRGSGEFEGQQISLKGTRVIFNHYREYAFGISKKYSSNLTLGIKAKLLFGKFNFTTGNSSFGLYVEPGTRNILFDMDGGFNSSLPYGLRQEGPEIYRFQNIYSAPVLKHLMNPRNPGIAFDFGFIYKYNDQWTFSGSLLDLGFIWYRSNLTNYKLSGNDRYTGPFADGQITDTYLWDVFDELNLNMTESVTAHSYIYFLDPRLYLGAAHKLNKKFDLNFLLYNRLLPGKLQTGATLSLLTRADKALKASVSWSYMNNSFFNLGMGVVYGERPLQLYVVSDNILGFILPLSTKNVNLRLGINLNLGCREIFNIDQCGCDWLKAEQNRRLRKDKFRRGN